MNEVTSIGAMSRVEAEGFDYQAEADKTCSVVWNPQYVDYDDLLRNLRQFAELANILNLYKKLLFRGKQPGELDMRMPSFGESVAGNGGHISALDLDLAHGVIGVCTEAGETAELLIDVLEGKAGDRVAAIEESGDLRWYINRLLRWAGCTDEQCERINIDKLHGRGHANGLNVFADANRDLERERRRLEAAVQPEPAPLLPLGPHGDEEDDGFITVHPAPPAKPSAARARCMGGRFCNHRPGECTADPAYQATFERRPIGGCEGMDC